MTEPETTAAITEFFDAAVWQNLPHRSAAAIYNDGQFAVPADFNNWLGLTAVRRITVTGDYRACGIVDWEPGNPVFTPAGLRRFVRGRRGMSLRARVYCDRADASEAVAALTEGADTNLRDYAEWWIATLDNRPWTAAELAAELAGTWGAPIPAGAIWANQNIPGGGYDTSTLFGIW